MSRPTTRASRTAFARAMGGRGKVLIRSTPLGFDKAYLSRARTVLQHAPDSPQRDLASDGTRGLPRTETAAHGPLSTPGGASACQRGPIRA